MNNINNKIKKDLHLIFRYYDINKLSEYQKRKLIFNYLCNNLSYNWLLYSKIFKDEVYQRITGNKTKLKRDIQQELIDVILTNKGICNSISEYYKILLSKVGIYSGVAIVDHGNITKHALNIVYDSKLDQYSIDDISSVLALKWSKKEAFDYNLEDAHNHNQGLSPLFKTRTTEWMIIPSSWIYSFIEEQIPTTEIEKEAILIENLPNILDKPKRKRCSQKRLNLPSSHT